MLFPQYVHCLYPLQPIDRYYVSGTGDLAFTMGK